MSARWTLQLGAEAHHRLALAIDAAAVLWGHLSDLRGPGFVSLCASLLYLIGYGLLGWRYQASVALDQQGLPLPEGQWVFLCFYYFLAGCATAASYFGAIIASTKSLRGRHSGLGESRRPMVEHRRTSS